MKASHPYHVLITPVLSEESTIQTESNNKYVFKVDPRSTKKQIREAIEAQWTEVKVSSVNTMNYDGKKSNKMRTGRRGQGANWKKAIVTLRQGDTIDLI
jgi:large subunit ribosomal protein L23